MKTKRVVILTLILSMLLVSANAFALSEDLEQDVQTVTVEIIPAIENTIDEQLPVFTLRETLARGSSVPTALWNFGNGAYQGHIDYLVNDTLFTNYLFQPSASGNLILQSTFYREYIDSCNVIVTLYRADTKTVVSSATYPTNWWPANTATAMKWSGLDPNKTYYYTLYNSKTAFNCTSGDFHVRQS